MTLLVKNEADIVEANLAFHLNAGVDFVVATDTVSEDGTLEVLESYAQAGVLHLLHEPDPDFLQTEVVTRMARLAAVRFGADWVINCDADEFWWPRKGSLGDVLEVVPPSYGCVRGMWRHFVARPPTSEFFAERMTVRLCKPVTDRDHAFSPHFKTAHRGDADVRVGGGNHDVSGGDLRPLLRWYPIDVLHFPIRSREQCERKYLQWRTLDSRGDRPPDPRRADAYRAIDRGGFQSFYESHLVDDTELEAGLRDERYAVDTRLRDALRSLRARDGGADRLFELPASGATRLGFSDSEVDRGYLAELGALEEGSVSVRLERRVRALEDRVSRLEASFPARVQAAVATQVRRLRA